MKTKYLSFCICIFLIDFTSLASAQSNPARIAKINYFDVKELLIEKVLALPEQQELKEDYEDHLARKKADGEKWMKKALEAQKSGQMTISMSDTKDQMKDFELSRKVEDMARDEFAILTEKLFGEQYDLILEGGYSTRIVYSNVAIADLTPKFRQHLIKK